MNLIVVGKRIKKLRISKKLTQLDFAKMCNFDRTYLSRVENGKQNLTLEIFFVICDKLDILPKDFFNF